MKRQSCALLVAALATGFFSLHAAHAASVLGTLNFTGDVSVNATKVDFLPAGTGLGTVAITAPASQSGSFLPLANTAATIKDLDTAVTPVGPPISIPAFLTFAANPDIRIDLAMLFPGVFSPALLAVPPAVGQTASPPNSMYNLVNLPGAGGTIQSTLSFAVDGNAVRISTGETTPISGSFTMQFGQPYQNLVQSWDLGTPTTTSFSATFTAIPEPASLALLASSGLCLLLRRRPRA